MLKKKQSDLPARKRDRRKVVCFLEFACSVGNFWDYVSAVCNKVHLASL
jgi:hypothetical protein